MTSHDDDGPEVRIEAGRVALTANLGGTGEGARGIVVLAHGSGSSRGSPRSRAVARSLRARGLATLLVDLLTPEEEAQDARTGHLRFDVDLLGERLVRIVDLLARGPATAGLHPGLFGASTGGGAALVAAAARPRAIGAVVSRGGRPDLAGAALGLVRAPTLLIVGGDDAPVIRLNETALAALRCERRLAVVPRAGHLFEERGALPQVAALAGEWFMRHLDAPDAASRRLAARSGAASRSRLTGST